MTGLREDASWAGEGYSWLERFLGQLPLPEWASSALTMAVALVLVGLVAWIAYYVVKYILLGSLSLLVQRSRFKWGHRLLERKVLHYLGHMGPAVVIHLSALYFFPASSTTLIHLLHTAANFYIVLMLLLAINGTLKALHDMYLGMPVSKDRPLKTYLQVVQIVLFSVGGIVLVSILVNKNPSAIFLGLGAMAAVLMLVFRDTILGLVASVQASANNMVKPGDWIEMPSRQADGNVLEISLNTVKVQNFDRTIVTFPTYALVSESIKNWKGMEESTGRQMVRSLLIDARTVRFLTPAEVQELAKIDLLADYLNPLLAQMAPEDASQKGALDELYSRENLTNLGVFRRYVTRYLQTHPAIDPSGTCFSRTLQDNGRGIPLQLYCYISRLGFVDYNGVQGDIFDHLMAVLPRFGLRLYQEFTGTDLRGAGEVQCDAWRGAPLPEA